MPIYNYKCPTCQNEFEKIVPHYDTEAQETCPKCGAPSVFFIPQGSRNQVKFLFNYLEPGA